MLLHELITPFVLAYPGVPEPMLIRTYLDSVREFCTQTHAWVEALERSFTIASVDRRRIATLAITSPPTDAEVYDLSYVEIDEKKLEREKLQVALRWPGTRPKWFQGGGINQVMLAPAAAGQQYDALIGARLRPTLAAAEVSDTLLNEHRETFEAGAHAKLLMMPNQPFTNPRHSAVFSANFQLAVAEWKDKAAEGGQSGHNRAVRYGGL